MSKFAFVGSNPSHIGPDSPAIKNLRKWWDSMDITDQVAFFNVSNEVTPNNRPLRKSEYQLGRLVRDLSNFDKVVALGRTASEALEMIGVPHFRLPHPSPRNRVLNDQLHVRVLLLECRSYLEDWNNGSKRETR